MRVSSAGPLAVRIVLMSAQILGIVTAFTLTKAVRDAVFLARFRMHDLAIVSLVLTLLSGAAVAAHQRWIARRFSRGVSAVVSLVIVAASLVGFDVALRTQHGWAAWGLYLWSGVFGVFLVAQFWIMAVDVFDAREARRAYPLAAAAASSGGVLGGLMADWLSDGHGGRDALLIVSALLLLCAVFAGIAWRLRSRDRDRDERAPPALVDPRASLRALASSPLLRTAAILLLCSSVAGTLLDWQLKAVARVTFHSQRGAMTEFFGRVMPISSLLALVLQIGTSRLLRCIGVARALLLLPMVMFTGAALLVSQPALGASLIAVAFTARVGEMGVRYAVDKPAMELLYMPVEGPVRAAAKGWLDTVADRLGGAVTALLWLAMQFAFDVEEPGRVRLASVLVASIAIGWIAVAWRVRGYHLDAFRFALARTGVPSKGDDSAGNDAENEAMVQRAIAHGNAAEVLVALELMAEAPARAAHVDLAPLIQHHHPAVRAKAVDAMRLRSRPLDPALLRVAANDPSPSVRMATLEWILSQHAELLANGIASDAPPWVSMVLDWAREPLARRRSIAAEMARSPDPTRRAAAAVLAGHLGDHALLRGLFEDADPSVVAAALGSVRAPRDRDEIAWLLRLGVRAGLRGYAVDRLAHASVTRLEAAWQRSDSTAARGLLCDALAHARAESAAERLATLARRADGVLRRRAWRRLAMRRSDGGTGPSLATCEQAIGEQLDRLASRILARDAIAILAGRGGATNALLSRALDENIDQETAAVFDLLALVAPARETREAWLWLREGTPKTRPTCIEFLDNALPASLRTEVVPWLEPADRARSEEILVAARVVSRPNDTPELLRSLASCDEGWLRALAVDALGRQGLRTGQPPARDRERDERVEQVIADLRVATPWPI